MAASPRFAGAGWTFRLALSPNAPRRLNPRRQPLQSRVHAIPPLGYGDGARQAGLRRGAGCAGRLVFWPKAVGCAAQPAPAGAGAPAGPGDARPTTDPRRSAALVGTGLAQYR